MEKPDFSHMSTSDLAAMFLACNLSRDPSDKEFAKFVCEEIKRRKPEQQNSTSTTTTR